MAEEMFRPPLQRGMRSLDRACFKKTIPLSAARILNNQNISKIRGELDRSKDALLVPRIKNVCPDPSPEHQGKRCLLLRPEVNEQGQKFPWSSKLDELRESNAIQLIPYNVQLDYDYWSYAEIAWAVLPNAGTEDFPSSFQTVGHVAHLNLRDQFLPYKTIIAELILDKNPGIKTVINKIDDVGEESEYRTFKYELLAGENNLNVSLKEQDCVFDFDYSKVYWNSRLNTEHERLVSLFQEGEAVCDVMAGIGPFAIPAGKKHVFVLANDKNPESYKHLEQGITRNKVQQFVRAYNEDGHTFIKKAAMELMRSAGVVTLRTKQSRKSPVDAQQKAQDTAKRFTTPKSFAHYVMNLPASAIDFLPNFVGLYAEKEFDDVRPSLTMPMVHCYCFDTKSDDNAEETRRICQEVSKRIGYTITPDTPETTIYDVRDVAPKKRMFCASFRLPNEVAFRSGSQKAQSGLEKLTLQ